MRETIAETMLKLLCQSAESGRAKASLWSSSNAFCMTGEEIAALPASLEGAFLPGIEITEEKNDARTGVITVEYPPEEQYDTLPTQSFELTVRFRDVILEWDFYMNKVETPGM